MRGRTAAREQQREREGRGAHERYSSAPEWDQGDVLRILIMRSLPGLEAEQGVERSAAPAASPEPAPLSATPAKGTAKKTTRPAK